MRPALRHLHPALRSRAQDLTKEYDELQKKLCDDYDTELELRVGRISPIVEAFKHYTSLTNELTELKELMSDPDFGADAEKEYQETTKELDKLEENLQKLLVPTNPFVDKPTLLEIRPGVGGSEAALFAADLLSMYQSYAQKKHWKAKLVSHSTTDFGGTAEAILHIEEPGSYGRLQYEGGVHRVQRVPDTEAKGRVHTSTAAVVVLPDVSTSTVEDDERMFGPDELRIDVMRASGSGGQHVNTTESAVRIVHLPTGMIVTCQDERSQHKNKAKALMVLRARLAEKERQEKEKEERSKRTAQVSSTERGDRIRTYNYPNNRITDHRCGFTINSLTEVMAGNRLDELVDAVDEWAKAESVKALKDKEA